jgi:uncharacterized protein (DUF1800 family)
MDRKAFLTSGLLTVSEPLPMQDPGKTDELQVKTDYMPVADPSLLPYQPTAARPWDRRRLLHLLRRTGYGAAPERVNEFMKMGPSDAVDAIIDQALKAPRTSPPTWMNLVQPGPRATQDEQDSFNMKQGQNDNEFRDTISSYALQPGLHAKLFMFWHNHFVTQKNEYGYPQSAFLYSRLIQDYMFGNFKTFTYEMGLTPAMLVYLNNNQNRRGAPNTNYARELLELFTLGEGNDYTEKDIKEIARAITGYQTHDAWHVGFFSWSFDNGPKTIFGVTDNFDYDGVINLLFEARRTQIARHICGKLYRYFVYPNGPSTVIDGLVKVFLDSDMHIAPVLKTLFKSRHFFDDEFIGSGISAPYEYYGYLKNTFSIPDKFQEATYFSWFWLNQNVGQQLLDPPNVAGWQGHRAWLDTNYLPQRWNMTPGILYNSRHQLLAFAKKMTKPNDPYALAREMAEYVIPVRLSDAEYKQLGEVLLGGIPAYEWNIEQGGAINRVLQLVQYICNLPDSHLN